MIAPFIHLLLPVFDALSRNDLREYVKSIIISFANFTVVPPLCIINRINRWHWKVFFSQSFHLFLVPPGFFLVLRSGPDLIMILWLNILELFSFVVVWCHRIEILLHKINVITVVLKVHSWISDYANSKKMERVRNSLAKVKDLFRILIFSSYKRVKVNDWDVFYGNFLWLAFHVCSRYLYVLWFIFCQ